MKMIEANIDNYTDEELGNSSKALADLKNILNKQYRNKEFILDKRVKELNTKKEKQNYQKFSYKEVIEKLNNDELSKKYNLTHKILPTKNKQGYLYKCYEKQNEKNTVFEKYLPSTEQTIIKMAGMEAFKKAEEQFYSNNEKSKEVAPMSIEDAIKEREKRLDAAFIGETPDDIKFIDKLAKEDRNEALINKLVDQISQIKALIEKNDFRTEYYRRNDGEINIFVINRNGKEMLAGVIGFEPIAIDVAVERFETIKTEIEKQVNYDDGENIKTIGNLFPEKTNTLSNEKDEEEKALAYQNTAERLHDKFGHPKLLKKNDHPREEFGEAVLEELKELGHTLANEANVYISPDNKEIKVFVESNDDATREANYILERYLGL